MSETHRRTIRVALGDRSYDVVVGPGLLAEAGERTQRLLPRGRAAIIADKTAYGHYEETLKDSLEAAGVSEIRSLVLLPGEERKSFAALELLCETILSWEIERNEAIFALGGGVIGDLAGFAAAIVKRGIPFVQIPTTLLSQVDSSVGGKTAINAKAGKNLIGAFHQPSLVLADLDTLDTLPLREVQAGFSEIVKSAVIEGEPFLAWLEGATPAFFAGDAEARAEAVARSVAFKAGVVARDERESGERALLNLGHTFGHAFEAEAGYDADLRHGEAVAVGCALAADYAAALGRAPASLGERIRAILKDAGLPREPADLAGAPFDPEALLIRMRSDKKNKDGRIRLVLPSGPGACETVDEENPERLLAFLEERAG